MAYFLNDEYVALPLGFRPTMSTFTGNLVVLTDGNTVKRYSLSDDDWKDTNRDVGQVTSLAFDRMLDKVLVGKKNSNVFVCDVDWTRFWQWTLLRDDAVTALISDGRSYVAHGKIVSKFRDLRIDGAIQESVTLPDDDKVEFMLRHYLGVICFANNKLYFYNFILSRLLDRIDVGIASRTVLCAKLMNMDQKLFVVYTNGILSTQIGLNGRFIEVVFRAFPDHERALSACVFGEYIAILSEDGRLTIRDTTFEVLDVPEIVYRLNPVPDIGILCGTVDDSGKFVLVTDNKLVFYSFLREQEESSDSSSDEDVAGADPAVGSKRREIMPEREEGDTEDRYKAKRMAFVRQALQHLTPEERIVLLTADSAELKKLYEETCTICQDPLHKRTDDDGSEVPRKKPITSECEHTICEDCETQMKESARRNHQRNPIDHPDPTPKCPTCRTPWKRSSVELLLF